MLKISILLMVAVPALLAQPESFHVGEIEFFGSEGYQMDRIRGALPVHEHDTLAFADLGAVKPRISSAVQDVTGQPATDVAFVCCDDHGQGMIYVGLGGRSSTALVLLSPPKGLNKLPPTAIALYGQTMKATEEAVVSGKAGEDGSKGYSLSEEPKLRSSQLEIRKYALAHERLLREVLAHAADPKQRKIAAHMLGYADPSEHQIDALVDAARDPDNDVRNNAIRALGLMARSDPKFAARIPPGNFIKMLTSGTWTDRNKAGMLMMALTKNRDAALLSEVRAAAYDALVEMAAWRSLGHAFAYRMVLGRINGIEEGRLTEMANKGQVDEILNLTPRRP